MKKETRDDKLRRWANHMMGIKIDDRLQKRGIGLKFEEFKQWN